MNFYYCEFCELVYPESDLVVFITVKLCPVHLERVSLVDDEEIDCGILDYLAPTL